MNYSTQCPNCSSDLRYAAEHRGRTARCSVCSHRFTIPLLDETPEEIDEVVVLDDVTQTDLLNLNLSDFGLAAHATYSHTPLAEPVRVTEPRRQSSAEESLPAEEVDIRAFQLLAIFTICTVATFTIVAGFFILSMPGNDSVAITSPPPIESSQPTASETQPPKVTPGESNTLVAVTLLDNGEKRKAFSFELQKNSANIKDPVSAIDLANDRGIKLERTPANLSYPIVSKVTTPLDVGSFDVDNAKISRLISFIQPWDLNTPTLRAPDYFPGRVFGCMPLWSNDGRFLYVLRPLFRNQHIESILKIDTSTWTVVNEVLLNTSVEHITGLCWTSEGLTFVCGTPRDARWIEMRTTQFGLVFIPLLKGEQFGSRLFTLDPETLELKSAWTTPVLVRLQGNTSSPMVYATAPNNIIAAINVKTGELIDAVAMPKPIFVGSQMSAVLTDIRLTPDGKQLFACQGRDISYLQMYRTDNGRMTLDAEFRAELLARNFELSPDGKFMCYLTKQGYVTASIDNLDNAKFVIPSPESSEMVYFPNENTSYLCSDEGPGSPITLTIAQGPKRFSFNLNTAEKTNSTKTNSQGAQNEEHLIKMTPLPDSRGVMVITSKASYIVDKEISKSATNTVDNKLANEKTKSSIAKSNDANRAPNTKIPQSTPPTSRNARTSPPGLSSAPIELTKKKGTHKGSFWELPSDYQLRGMATDPHSGDIVMVGTRRSIAKTNWLAVASRSSLDSDRCVISKSLTFPDLEYKMSVCYKRIDNKTYILLYHHDVLWTLDPKSMQPVHSESNLAGMIDFRNFGSQPISVSDKTIGASSDSNQSESADHTIHTISASRSDDPFIVFNSPRSSHTPQALFNLQTQSFQRTAQRMDTALPWAQWQTETLIQSSEMGDLSLTRSARPVGKANVVPPEIISYSDLFWNQSDASRRTILNEIELLKYDCSVVSQDKDMVFLQRSNDSKRFVLTSPIRDRALQQPALSYYQLPYDDFENDRLIVLIGPNEPRNEAQGLWIVPLASLKDKLMKRIDCVVEVPAQHSLNQETRIKLLSQDPGIEYKLVSSPAGARLIGNEIVWTPDSAQLGKNSFTLSLNSNNENAKATFVCEATYHKLTFAEPGTLHTDPKTGVTLWSTREHLHRIDLDKGMVVATAELLGAKHQRLQFSNDKIFLFDVNTNQFHQRNANSLVVEHSFFLAPQVKSMTILGGTIAVTESRVPEKTGVSSTQSQMYQTSSYPDVASTPDFPIFEYFKAPSIVRCSGNIWRLGPFHFNVNTDLSMQQPSLSKIAIPLVSSKPSNTSLPFLTESSSSESQPNGNLPNVLDLGEQYKLFVSSTPAELDSTNINRRQVRVEITDLKTKIQRTLILGNVEADGDLQVARTNDRLLVATGRYLFAPTFSDLKVEVNKSPKDATYLTIEPTRKLVAIRSQKNADLTYKISGGNEPYEMQLQFPPEIQSAIGAERISRMFKIDQDSATIVVDGKEFNSAIRSLSIQESIAEYLIQYQEGVPTMKSPDQLIDSYIDYFNSVGKSAGISPIKGLPMRVPVMIRVTDGLGRTQSITEDWLIEIDLNDAKLSAKSILRSHDSDSTTTQSVTTIPPTNTHFAEQLFKLGTEGNWDKRSALRRAFVIPTFHHGLISPGDTISISERLRKIWPKKQLLFKSDPIAIACFNSILADANRVSIDSVSTNSLPTSDSKERRPVNGAPFEGQLASIDTSIGKVRFSSGASQPRPQDSETKLDYDIAELTLETQMSLLHDLHKLPRLRNAGNESQSFRSALESFTKDFFFPPKFPIVNERGKPLLSWRVMLLPYIGRSDLFEMFHLDEPWDSEHNIQLLPMMPIQYSLDGSNPQGFTNLVAIQIDPSERIPSRSNVSETDTFATGVLFRFEDNNQLVEWTKPSELLSPAKRSNN